MTFLSEPAERPYGIEATMRDDSGNLISLTQPFAFDPEAMEPLTAARSGAGRRSSPPRRGLTPWRAIYNHLVMSMTATADLSEVELDRAFGALADPTRRAILARLTGVTPGCSTWPRPSR